MKSLIITSATILLSFFAAASEKKPQEWKDLSYFKRIDLKMRVTKFEKPIVVEWGNPEGENITPQIKAASLMMSTSNMDYEEWRALLTEEYINKTKFTKEKFAKYKSVNIKGHPEYRSIILPFEQCDALKLDSVEEHITRH